MSFKKQFFERKSFEAKSHEVLREINLELPEIEVGGIESERSLTPVYLESLFGFSYDPEATSNLIDAIENKHVRAKFEKKSDLFKIELLPVKNLPDELVHITAERVFARNENSDIWGNSDKDSFTYLQTTRYGVEPNIFSSEDLVGAIGEYYGERFKRYVRVYIDTRRLLKLRDVYIDPESLNMTEEEFGHSFAVLGGMPREAIVRAEVMKISVRKPAFEFDNSEAPWHLSKDEVEELRKDSEVRLRIFFEQHADFISGKHTTVKNFRPRFKAKSKISDN